MSNKRASDLFDNDFGREIDFGEVFRRYARHWKWFLLSILVFMGAGYVYLRLQTPVYRIETDILIKDDKSSRGGADRKDLFQELNLNSSAKIIDNEIQILKSVTLMRRVVADLHLQTSFYVQNRFTKRAQYKTLPFDVELLKPSSHTYKKDWPIAYINDQQVKFNGKVVRMNFPVQTQAGLLLITPTHINTRYHNIFVKFTPLEALARSFAGGLDIEPVSKNATVLHIILIDAIPERGEDVLNKLVEEYDNAGVEDKNVTMANQLKFVEDRIVDISKELDSVERSVQHYKSANNIIDISSQSSMFLSGIKDNDDQLQKIKLELGVLNNFENYVEGKGNQLKMPSTLGIDDPTLLGLVQQLGEAQLKREGLLRTIPETNPVVSSIDDEIRAIKQTLEQTIKNVRSGLLATQSYLENQSQKFEGLAKSVPSKERGLIDVMRQQDVKNSLFTYLLQKREEIALELASTTPDSRTIDAAMSSGAPVKPVKRSIYLTFFMLGLVIPGLVIFLKDLFNYKITRKSDIEKLTRTPILAEISRADESSLQTFAVLRPRSMVSEQIKALRTNLQFLGSENETRVLLFTSNISGEGKSFISLNLGASLANIEKKVIILELDLRKPNLRASIGIQSEAGLSNYLIGKVDYKEIIRPIPQQENYYIITSGPLPPNPSELLSNGKIGVLIEELKKEFDYILLDAPPVGLVTDAQILSKWADATLFLVRHGYTAKSQIPQINEFYRKKIFKNLNIIYNSIEKTGQYGYNYGYGYGYYLEDKKKDNSPLKIFRKGRK